MKAISILTIILFLICCFTSCDAPENEHGVSTRYDVSYGNVRVETITIDSVSHQYLFKYTKSGVSCGVGLTHYPECKFCKNNCKNN